MFRLFKLKPPHGWNAVAWELAIVTLGVLLALAAQQWAETRSKRADLEESRAALRAELGEHYGYAVEFRVVYPCLQAQLNALRDRVLASGATLDPAPVQQDASFHYVLYLPSKVYPTDAWDAAISDGTVQRFEPGFRRLLAGHYGQLPEIREMTSANNADGDALFALTRPLPLDAGVRYSIVKQIEQVRGRLEYLDLIKGQVIDYVQRVRMLPSAAEAEAVTERYGTFQYCKAHKLPMRAFKDAMKAIPN